jgi:zinc protease
MTDGLSARLNRVLVYDKQLCTQVASFSFGTEQAGIFVMQATARPGAGLKEIEQIVADEIARLARSGPTAAELQRARNKIEYEFVTGLERIGGFGGKADLLAQYNTFLGDPGMFEADLNRFRSATSAGVQAAVGKWLDTRNRVVLRFHPEKSERPVAAIDRAQVPQLGADRTWSPPEVKSAKLKNGLEVLVVERHELPKAAVRLISRVGAAHDPEGKEGLANMLIRTIDMGAGRRKALQIEDELGDLGTRLAGAAQRESSILELEVLKRNLEPAVAILADVALNPLFPDSEVDRERKRQIDAILQQEKNPDAIAARLQAMIAFGPKHPYGRPAAGFARTVKGITREDIAGFHREHFKPASSALIFAGDVTLAEAMRLAERHFGGWTGGSAPSAGIPEPQPMARGGKVFLVDRPDSAQTVVAQIVQGPARTGEDYYLLQLANTVYGGTFGSRLNLNLREDKGYSYGASSYPALYSKAGMWIGSAGVQTDKTKESVVEFVAEMKNIGGAKPISEQELENARLNRVRGYAQQFEALSRVADQVGTLWALGLPMTELQREPEETRKATLEQVNATAQRYAKPAEATLLLVGDLGKIRSGVQSLKLGEIVVLDVEGNPVQSRSGSSIQ